MEDRVSKVVKAKDLVLSLSKWILKYRKLGLHWKHFNDKDYIDWFVNHAPHLKQYKDIHQGEDCFIVGNGPSLNKTDLNLLKDYHVFGLNKIHLIFEKYPEFKLSYHTAVNPLVITQTVAELNQDLYGCPSFLSYHAAKDITYTNPKVHQIHTRNTWSFYGDITAPISEGYTVTYVAMQIAYYMGFKNIFLVGVDHNFQQKGKPNEQQEFKGDDLNHFHPDYFKGMQWHLADLEGNEASYALAKHQFHQDGREIYDATVDGKLEIFQKIPFHSAVEKAKKKA